MGHAPRRRVLASLAWAGPFAIVLTVLLVRNAFLFSTPEYEEQDMAANSILIEQARRFTLLVGNYSREGFNHPGPAFLYVASWGESLFYDALHVVPTAWNGQLIALYLLNAFFAACVVAVGYGWGDLADRQRGGGAASGVRLALAALAAVGLYGVLHPLVFSSDWMPYQYAPAYLAFVASVASVAAGRTADAWIATLSGWFLIHGHACFLFFVPLLWRPPRRLSAGGRTLRFRAWRWRRASRCWPAPRSPSRRRPASTSGT